MYRVRQFLFLARRDVAAWQAPCEEEQRCQGQKGACSVHLNLKRFGYIVRSEETKSLQRPFAAGMPKALRGAGSAACEPPEKGSRRVSGGTSPPRIGSVSTFGGQNDEQGPFVYLLHFPENDQVGPPGQGIGLGANIKRHRWHPTAGATEGRLFAPNPIPWPGGPISTCGRAG